MIVAIDYDNTYTLCPSVWNEIIKLFKDTGHIVICVTARQSDSSMTQEVSDSIGKLVPIVFAGKEWKREAALKNGYKVDVWIDDTPEMIGKQLLINVGWPS